MNKLISLLKNGLIAGIIGGAISGLLNYFFLPMPESIFSNAIGHGIGGFICGFISCIIGIIIFSREENKKIN